MDPILNISTSKSINVRRSCIFCQERQSDNHLVDPGEDAFQTVKRSAALRQLKFDPKNEAATARVDLIANRADMCYHRKCHSNFTNSTNISRLRPKEQSLEFISNQNVTLDHNLPTKWEHCIICQKPETQGLRQVKKFAMCETIKQLSENDAVLKSRIESVNLISVKAKYHSVCILKSQQPTAETKTTSNPDKAMMVLCDELKAAAERGEVLLLDDVWKRYTMLSAEFDQTIPASYLSRRSSFKDKLVSALDGEFQFYQPLNKDIHERHMMLIPTKFQHSLTAQMAEINYFKTQDQNTPLNGNKYANIVKAALETKREMQAKSGESSLNITEEMAIAMIPQSLYIYLSIIMDLKDYRKDEFEDGDKEECNDDSETDSDDDSDLDIDDDESDLESDDEHQNENKFTKGLFTKVLSIAQDIVYVASKGRKITPKHLGLALSLHQETRKKELVTLLNKAGNCMSYKQVLQVDNTLAELTLSTLDNETGAVIPPNICEKSDSQNSILQMTADNIDILTKTLDGKNTFHATQMVVFQRGGKTTDEILQATFRKKRTGRLQIPAIVNTLPDPIQEIESTPDFKNPVDITWYDEIPGNCKINEKDLSFLFSRQKQPEGNRIGWTKFNKDISTNNSPLTASGFMPLILHPAHEYNTLTLVLERCISVANKLKYKHVVLTVDQALHWRLKDIIWTSDIFKERIILKMGGLHLANNYIKAIGQHMIKTGLAEIWLESGILAEGAIAKVLSGTDYAKAMRAHKLTYQALWRILIPKFIEYLKTKDKQKQAESLQELCGADADGFLTFFEYEENQKSVDEFLRNIAKDNITTAFWVQYIEYVSVLLDFTRSIRDARWKLYLPSLIRMLPLIVRYDHLNYLKSLIIYIADLHNLPIEIEEAFESGDFVVKRTQNKFNQVDADHAQEWLVGTSKDSGGITGIQNKDATLQRWALSFHWRTVITQKTYALLGVSSMGSKHNEEFPGRIKRDNHDEDELLKYFLDMKVFSDDNCSQPLHNLVTKDQATIPIQIALLSAFDEGLKHVKDFVRNRLIRQKDGNVLVDYSAPLSRTNPITMASMEKHKKPVTTEKKIMKCDANFLQRIIVSYEAGRPIDLPSIFKHELHTIPLGLAELDGSLRSGDQLSLMNLFLKNVQCPTALRTPKELCHYIYNADVVIAKLGNPKSIKTFGEYADKYISYIKELSILTSRLDILFDRYQNLTTKITSKQKASKMTPIRRVIESGNVPLPKSWNNFLSSNENKADLARFLSNKLSSHQFDDFTVITSGGFELVTSVSSSSNVVEAESLISNHKEADIRAVLHAIESKASTIVVNINGTEILALLVHFFNQMKCDELWLATGTTKKFVPIHTISSRIPNQLKKNILAFHAVTGSPHTSQLIRVTKAGAWKIFEKFGDLLNGLGDEILTEDVINAVEEFLLKCYMDGLELKTFDDARVWLFKKLKNVTDLPPTSDAIRLHIKRSHWTTYTWKNAGNNIVSYKDPIDFGWELGEENVYLPTLTSNNINPGETFEFIRCGCKTKCGTNRCKCRRQNPSMKCTSLCDCFGECLNSNAN